MLLPPPTCCIYPKIMTHDLCPMDMQSPLRVHSMEEADLIYLPIYAALECRLSQAMDGDAHKLAYHARVSCPISVRFYQGASCKAVLEGLKSAVEGGSPIWQ